MDKEEQEKSRDSMTSDYVHNVKEKAALKEEIVDLTKRLNQANSKNYDLSKKIQKLGNENDELHKHNEKKTKKKKPAKRKTPKKKETKIEEKNEDPFENMEMLYEEIARQFPTLPLSTVLVAQQKFTEADTNNDGTIDSMELEQMLDSAALFVTNTEIKKILTDIDADESESLDFFECLKVCDQLHNNRKTNLPTVIENQKSALCSIQ